MILTTLEIKNFRSLKHVLLDNLGNFNVLIGRNNSGKSSVFNALLFLSQVIHNERPYDAARVSTAGDTQQPLEIRLVFQLRQQDREDIINLLITGGYPEHSRTEMLQSPLFRHIEFLFKSPPGDPYLLHLRETKIRAQDGKWAAVQQLNGEERTNNPASRIINLATTASRGGLSSRTLDLDSGSTNINIEAQQLGRMSFPDPATVWPHQRLFRYLDEAFFFNPFRHSTPQLPVQETSLLSQNGANLAQVLHTINSNNRKKLQEIENFIQSALPDVGTLQAPLQQQSTEVKFRSASDQLIPLQDMGGGIEQLLMAATVLLTTKDESTIFLEEPESHLHAGAQRFLIERLQVGNRQVFLSTHSPIFINQPRRRSLYQVTFANGHSAVSHLTDTDNLGNVLCDIGARNSDLLLSDAVFFVEGPGDRDVMRAWGETLGMNLAEQNITILPMGGGDKIERGARMRSEILAGVSQRSPVPHMFLLDRDERSDTEVQRLQQSLGEHVHFLEKREIENYLLVPRAILEALREKYRDDGPILERIEAGSIEGVEILLRTTAGSLYEHILLKRIRNEVGGLPGGLLPRDAVAELVSDFRQLGFVRRLRAIIRGRANAHIARLNLRTIVKTQKAALDKAWANHELQLSLAPGEELVAAVFHHFGGEYKKPQDTVRIAKMMQSDEIAEEIVDILNRLTRLTAHS